MNRQQVLYLLPLPYDVIHIICSYSFYDRITGNTRNNKKQIITKIKNALCSRKNPSIYWDYTDITRYPDESEVWACCFTDKLQRCKREVYFLAENCRICGNYKMSNSCNYSLYELGEAELLEDDDWYNEILSKLPKNIRCDKLSHVW